MSANEIKFLESKSFSQDPSKHSGFFFLQEDGKTYVLIQANGDFFIEVYELLHDGDSSYYEDMYKIDPKPGQSLEDFINSLGF